MGRALWLEGRTGGRAVSEQMRRLKLGAERCKLQRTKQLETVSKINSCNTLRALDASKLGAMLPQSQSPHLSRRLYVKNVLMIHTVSENALALSVVMVRTFGCLFAGSVLNLGMRSRTEVINLS